MDPEQTAPIGSLIWVHTVCRRGYLNISADEKSRRLLLRLAHSTNICIILAVGEDTVCTLLSEVYGHILALNIEA